MASITKPKADLAMLAERLGNVAHMLRSLTANNPRLPEELGALSAEIRAVGAELGRKWNEPSEQKGPRGLYFPPTRARVNCQLDDVTDQASVFRLVWTKGRAGLHRLKHLI